jgi:small subunit ribosomal protein S21
MGATALKRSGHLRNPQISQEARGCGWTFATSSVICLHQSHGLTPGITILSPRILRSPGEQQTKGTGFHVQVLVRDNNVDQALRALKKKMQREGIFREMKMRDYYEKPSEKRAREKAEAVRRVRKLARKRMQREGLLPSTPRPAR